MYRDSNEKYFSVFTKIVLELDFDTLSKPLDIAISRMPLPKTVSSIEQYYQNFLPFILEEARAIIANGLECVDKYTKLPQNKQHSLSDAREFELSLKNKPKLPKNEGNPMFLHFSGKIPSDIEHGNSMNALLLEMTEISTPMRFIALVTTEKLDTSELFAKIIIDSSNYHDYKQCFAEGSKWKAHYLGSIISEQRMYDACLEATDGACMRQIASAIIPEPRTLSVSTGSCSIDHFNLSQREAIYAFLNANEGTTLLLQGPPGTGKTTTLIALLKQVASQDRRTMVSAHSNKGVQVLALKAVDEMPNIPMILIGVASKLPEKLKSIFLHDWYDIILSSFFSYNKEIELLVKKIKIHTSRSSLISNIEQNLITAEQALNKFTLVYFPELSDIKKQQLYKLSNDPLLASDFKGLYYNIDQLKLQSQSEHLWNTLLTTLNRLTGKWKVIKKDKLEKYLLDHSNIIFSTLITAGRKNMSNMEPIDYLLVDEAAQSVEAATLIPMRFRPLKTLLVGDTKQLPATVISPVLDDSDRRYSTHYKWSMMWRLIEENNQPSLMLDIQYRMHPHICQWPSGQYYANRLITSPDILPISTLDNKDITSRPYAIYQISGQAESRYGSNSPHNVLEANYVVKVIEHIRKKNGLSSIGVITPYAEQKKLIIQNLSQKRYLQKFVDINTVDGFQGDERDIIIISFTRTHVSEFLKEFRRLNVAITRAKICLIILAAPSMLSNDIGQLIRDARLRGVVYSEEDLNYILRVGVIAATQHKSEKTINELWKMAWLGDPESQIQYAKTLSNKAESLLWYRRAAENNNAEAQYYISQIYLYGNDTIKKDTQLGVSWLNKSARQNFPQAQYLLGKFFILGGIVVKNIITGIALCERAASSNLIDAIVFLANLYEEGIEVPRYIKRAEKYYRQAAKLNDLTSTEKLAELLSGGTLDNKREAIKWYEKIAIRGRHTAYYPLAQLLNSVFNEQEKAFDWYLKAADHGHREAQYEIGQRLKQGSHGCSIDILQSKHFFKLAATSGHIQAQFTYAGLLKEEGSYHEAMSYFQLAANRGHCESQYQYGLLMSNKNCHQAYSYYLKAAHQNHLLAQEECIRYQMQFNCDLKICLSFCETLAANGNSQAQYVLGKHCILGVTIAKNVTRGINLCERSANNDLIDAILFLAKLYEEGIEVTKDEKRAKKYYRQAARLNDLVAIEKLAGMLYNGASEEKLEAIIWYEEIAKRGRPVAYYPLARLLDNVANNQTKAFAWYLKAAEHGYSEAQCELGLRFNHGNHGCIKDVVQSKHFFKLAASSGHTQAQFFYASLLKEEGNIHEAMDSFKLAAEQEHCESQYQYALLLSNSNKPKAYSYYLKAARNDHLLSQQECIYYQIQFNCDLKDCLAFCEKLATQGNSQAQLLLARILDTGLVGTINKKLAYHYYTILAQNGHFLAQYYCAILLERGVSVERDLVIARRYYESCLDQCFGARLRLACLLLKETDPDLQNTLLVYNEQGQIKLQDHQQNSKTTELYQKPIELLEYYFKHYQEENSLIKNTEQYLEDLIMASPVKYSVYELGDINTCSAYANYLLGRIFEEGAGVFVDTTRALQHYELAGTGYPDANYRLGYIYELGLKNTLSSTAKFNSDKHKAYSYYLKAANQDHFLAKQKCVHYQIQFNCDLKTCVEFCETLTIQGDSRVQFLLARILDSGLIGTIGGMAPIRSIDQKQAYHYYTILAQNGHFLAQYYCAILLERGIKVERDLVIARQYYESCIEQCFEARLRLACLLLREIDYDLQNTLLVYNEEQDHANLKDHQQNLKTNELYKQPIELLEYYFKHYKEEKTSTKTTEQHLENLIIASRAKYSVYELGAINTRSAHANYLLGRIFQDGVGVFVNIKRALQHYKLASTIYPDASYRAGDIYEFAFGNKSVAKKYYQLAANKGHELATKRLTWSYWLFKQIAGKCGNSYNILDEEILVDNKVLDSKPSIKPKSSNCLIM